MITPDARLRCRPNTRSVVFSRLLSTGPYPVTSTCTTVGDTRVTSAAIESLNCRNGPNVCEPAARAGSAGTRNRHAAARHRAIAFGITAGSHLARNDGPYRSPSQGRCRTGRTQKIAGRPKLPRLAARCGGPNLHTRDHHVLISTHSSSGWALIVKEAQIDPCAAGVSGRAHECATLRAPTQSPCVGDRMSG